MKKLLSIIIVEYYCIEKLDTCVSSIEKHLKEINYEIIVVSNSKYNTLFRSKILNKFPNVKWIFNEKNLGYAKAVNRGIRASEGTYILILNPDAMVLDKNIIKAIQYLEKNQEVGLLGLKIINSKGVIEESFRSFMTPKVLMKRIFKRLIKKEFSFAKNIIEGPLEVDWVSGACMLTSREKIEIVGLMDERYFMYIEDMDWCREFWKKGFKVVYWPFGTIMHDASRRSSTDFYKKIFFSKYVIIHFVSYIKYLIKYFPESFCK